MVEAQRRMIKKPKTSRPRNPHVWKRSPLLSGKLVDDDGIVGWRDLRDDWSEVKWRIMRCGDMDYPTRQQFLASIVHTVEEELTMFTPESVGIKRGLGLLAFAWIHSTIKQNGKPVEISIPDDIVYMAAGYTKLLYGGYGNFNGYEELRPEILRRVKRALLHDPDVVRKAGDLKGSVLDNEVDCGRFLATPHDRNVLEYMLRYEPEQGSLDGRDSDAFKFTKRGALLVLKMMAYANDFFKGDLKRVIEGYSQADTDYYLWNRGFKESVSWRGLSRNRPFEEANINSSALAPRIVSYSQGTDVLE